MSRAEHLEDTDSDHASHFKLRHSCGHTASYRVDRPTAEYYLEDLEETKDAPCLPCTARAINQMHDCLNWTPQPITAQEPHRILRGEVKRLRSAQGLANILDGPNMNLVGPISSRYPRATQPQPWFAALSDYLDLTDAEVWEWTYDHGWAAVLHQLTLQLAGMDDVIRLDEQGIVLMVFPPEFQPLNAWLDSITKSHMHWVE